MYGGGANVWPGGGATGGVAGAGQRVLTMNGRSGGPASGIGFCGRPTSAVAHVPTQRSAGPLCASAPEWNHRIAYTTATATTVGRRFRMSRCVIVLMAPRFYSSCPVVLTRPILAWPVSGDLLLPATEQERKDRKERKETKGHQPFAVSRTLRSRPPVVLIRRGHATRPFSTTVEREALAEREDIAANFSLG